MVFVNKRQFESLKRQITILQVSNSSECEEEKKSCENVKCQSQALETRLTKSILDYATLRFIHLLRKVRI